MRVYFVLPLFQAKVGIYSGLGSVLLSLLRDLGHVACVKRCGLSQGDLARPTVQLDFAQRVNHRQQVSVDCGRLLVQVPHQEATKVAEFLVKEVVSWFGVLLSLL